MDRRRFLHCTGAAATLSLTGCVTLFDDGEYDIGMTADAFTPETYTIEVGDTVTWENTSTRAHTVTAYDELIPEDAEFFATGGYENEQTAREEWADRGGGGIDNGEQFAHTFAVPGNYGYVCIPHEQGGMIGTIVVEE
ncbi:cupredoxin domain-containing protein [Natronocalculus amylovorans]|uniref:Plastocyanin/azurin family copper-binding protein n=1 Tax=Natronocalculus amylovorans TaxID=2917812 RepID=A0AAE3FYJ0_9EURY|nr:plastocyanin/azurin family copper-binding protein [Natronocalculus amylovorans]MCL9817651.1 plastocyanin/azurin family copper-binding protein [Natronocalculus amylovorans]